MRLIIILFSLLLVSCNSVDYIQGDIKSTITSINYFKDIRTNTCYAEIISKGGLHDFTEVDCEKCEK
jgi:hypothetical protein